MVSVIIPTFGGGDGLKSVVDSILRQTYKEIEIIIVDDNGWGTENQIQTKKVIEEYVSDKRVIYITPETNRGGSSARNTGAKASKGKYLMFLDDDDTVSSDKIQVQVSELRKKDNSYGIAYCSTKVFVDEKLSNIIKAKKSGDILYDFLLGKVYMGTGTVLMRKEVWQEVGGYDETFVRHQDWEFFARVLDKYNAVAVDNVYFNRYITNRNLPKKIEVLEKHTDYYISFLQRYPFRISKNKKRKVINMNNSRIALACIKKKQIKKFFVVMSKYDNILYAYASLARFLGVVILHKLIGRKS